MILKSRWHAELEYGAALDEMVAASERVRGTTGVEVLGCEHPLVITLGRHAQPAEELVGDGQRSPPVVKTDRGGRATLHGPGQLMIYPIADLRNLGISVRDWVELLLTMTSRTLGSFDVINRVDLEQAGVWGARGKLAFLGLRIEQGVSRHGLSLNVSNDLSHFQQIRACGVSPANQKLQRLVEDHPQVTPEGVFNQWVREFQARA